MEDVAVYSGHEVLVEADDNSNQIVGSPRGISGQQARHHPIHMFLC